MLGNPPPKKVSRSQIIRPLPATVERAAIKFSLLVKQSVSYSLASRYVCFSLTADVQADTDLIDCTGVNQSLHLTGFGIRPLKVMK